MLGPDPASLDHAAALLAAGEVVAVPTETVYGLAAVATDPQAVAKVFEAKGRPASQPLIIHVSSATMARRYVSEFPATAQSLAEFFWPGPFTMVLGRDQSVPLEVTGGLESVAVRVPDHGVMIELIDRLGVGLAAPSANRYGHVSPTTAPHVLDDLSGQIAAVVDGGACAVGVESTIVAIDPDGRVRLLRHGGIDLDALASVLGYCPPDSSSGPVLAPGMVVSHYAPAAPVEILDADTLQRRLRAGLEESVLVISPDRVEHSRCIALGEADSFAAGLYAALRHGDDPAVTQVVVVPPASGPLLPAIVDRLTRAAHSREQD